LLHGTALALEPDTVSAATIDQPPARLENRLADLLGVKVDHAPARMLKARVREVQHAGRSLLFRDAFASLRDIADAIELIGQFTDGIDFDPMNYK
jgi:hypothetical protein